MTVNEKIEMLKNTIEFLYSKDSRNIEYISKLLEINENILKSKIDEWKLVKADEKHIKPSTIKRLNKNKSIIKQMLDSDYQIDDITEKTGIPSRTLSRYFKNDIDLEKSYELWKYRKKKQHIDNIEISIKKSSRDYIIEDIENEIWKPILGFENYFISNMGRVKTLSKRYNSYYLLKISGNSVTKRIYVDLKTKDGKRKNLQVSRLVGHAFVDGFSEVNNTINHIDGNVQNNKADNLEWVSQAINNKKSYDDLKKQKSIIYSKYGKFKKIILDDKYEFKTIGALARFLDKSTTQVYRYIDGITKTNHSFKFIF